MRYSDIELNEDSLLRLRDSMMTLQLEKKLGELGLADMHMSKWLPQVQDVMQERFHDITQQISDDHMNRIWLLSLLSSALQATSTPSPDRMLARGFGIQLVSQLGEDSLSIKQKNPEAQYLTNVLGHRARVYNDYSYSFSSHPYKVYWGAFRSLPVASIVDRLPNDIRLPHPKTGGRIYVNEARLSPPNQSPFPCVLPSRCGKILYVIDHDAYYLDLIMVGRGMYYDERRDIDRDVRSMSFCAEALYSEQFSRIILQAMSRLARKYAVYDDEEYASRLGVHSQPVDFWYDIANIGEFPFEGATSSEYVESADRYLRHIGWSSYLTEGRDVRLMLVGHYATSPQSVSLSAFEAIYMSGLYAQVANLLVTETDTSITREELEEEGE